ncbi:hypothetical protein [Bradyrhizobium sp.]|uniref:hypothetical protein n=1 Tax=Bradyrhizobium sp. TaxID=376 RepID=UPI003BAFA6F6
MSQEALEAVTSSGVLERAPFAGMKYVAFCDPSGGSSDSMTLAIGHAEGRIGTLDAIRERRAPFSPESVVEEFAGLLKHYGLQTVEGDRYAGEWPAEAFRRHGITYVAAKQPKSQIYLDLLPRINSGEVSLLDSPRLIAQFIGLERRTARSGRDSVDHAPGAHDDLCNAVAGVLVATSERFRTPVAIFGTYGLTGVEWQAWQSGQRNKFDGEIKEGPLAGGYAVSR